jgi:hypothetical protein
MKTMNVHTPARQADESQAEYRIRRAASNSIARAMNCPAPTWNGYHVKQHTNPEKNARRAAIKAAGGIRRFKRHGARLSVAA